MSDGHWFTPSLFVYDVAAYDVVLYPTDLRWNVFESLEEDQIDKKVDALSAYASQAITGRTRSTASSSRPGHRQRPAGLLGRALRAGPGGPGMTLYSAHQPDLLPYSGFWSKMANADMFDLKIWDQFVHKGYQRRVKMRDQWVTLPLVKGSSTDPINRKQITEDAPHTWSTRSSSATRTHEEAAALGEVRADGLRRDPGRQDRPPLGAQLPADPAGARHPRHRDPADLQPSGPGA